MKRFNKHIFICENKRPEGHPRGCCSEKGSLEIREHFKTRLKELGLNAEIRANGAGCLDACESGPTLVVYPEGVYYRNVQLSDVEEIIQKHIIENTPVERLVLQT